MSRRSSIVVGTALALTMAFPTIGRTDDKEKQAAVQDAVVQFGQAQPQGAPDAVTHFLDPDDVTINKGGTVTFVVNGGGHGIAIYPVSKKTTRDDIAADLCQGGTSDADRLGRSLVCNGTIVTPSGVVGTQNLRYLLTDGKDNVVIDTDTGANSPRIDDPTDRLIATSGAIPGADPAAVTKAGAFLTGTNATGAAGNRIQYRFNKTGRFLVICTNRGHSLNNHMFGFVNVVGADDDEK
jgi:plastocyanin